MARIILRDLTVIEDYGKPYIVAEVNSSHNGNVEMAKLMIDAAAEAGCHCVKFQSWSAESLYSATYYKANPISKRIVQKFSLTPEQLKNMAAYCHTRGVAFSSTPYSRPEVDFLLDECGAPFVKIASMDCNNYPYLRYIAKKHYPIVLSTGMSTIEEVEKAVEVFEEAGNSQICLLHCISIYPPEMETIHLNNILGLRTRFPQYPIGFSDHSHGIEIATAATALGAALIEKHLTLDRHKIGMDNQMATEPEEMKRMVEGCMNVQKAMGTQERVVLQAEQEQILKMRRSVIVTRDMKAGETLTYDALDAKRPGTGISPVEIDNLVGKKLTRDVQADMLLNKEDIEYSI
jgi:N-acetylneuraminate synthase